VSAPDADVDISTLPTRARTDVEKYLLPDERAKVVTRRHWAVLIEPTAKFVPLFLVGGWLLVLDPENRVSSSAGLIVLVVALIYYALNVWEWLLRHFIVSTRRVLLTSGIIVRTVTLLPLRRITDLTWQETLLGNLLGAVGMRGYGTFRFESAGQDQALRHLTYIPDAGELYVEVSRLLFGSDYGGAASGDDEGNPEPPPRGPRPPRASARPPEDRQDTEPIPRHPPQ
jgi:membrane protein YdbS with pleckstrin-like domain